MILRVAIGINMLDINADGSASKETVDTIINTYRLLSDRYYTHATPTLFNAGTINHTLSSCYLLSIDDSLNNIYSRLTDISKISKFSGGVGVHMSQVRASGSVIASTIGRSEGLVPLMRVFNESTRYVSQGGGKRKGSTAVYLEPWHADIESAILSQKQQGAPERLCRDLFLALWVPNLFMERVKQSIKTKKDVMWSLMCPNECPGLADTYGSEFESLYLTYEASGRYRKQIPIKKLWDLIMATQIETGKPYIMYKDHVNRKCNQNNCGTIKSSNLCVAGDTRILTDKGYIEIASAAGQTGTDQKLLKVITDDGCELQCTEYHRFSIVVDSGSLIKEARDLEAGDMLMLSEYPIIEGDASDDIKYPYAHGSHCGDQTKYFDTNGLQAPELIDLNAGKYTVPINATIENKLQWLAGLLDVAGLFAETDDTVQSIQIDSIHNDFLLDVKLMCNTLGLNPSKFVCVSKGPDCDETYRLLFHSDDTYKLYAELGLKTYRLTFGGVVGTRPCARDVRIKSVEEVDGLHDTYCFRSEATEMGIFNGMPTLNCSEITIYSDTDNVGVCNLASICLPRFVKRRGDEIIFDYLKLKEVMQTVVVNMNKVIDVNKHVLDQARASDDKNRPIGIGVQGLAEVFMMMKTPFDSPLAIQTNKNIFETMYYGALVASNQLAMRHGPYETFSTSMSASGTLQFDLWGVTPSSGLWDWSALKSDIINNGLRNSLLMAQMPTAGTSIVMNTLSESIEIPQSNIFTRSTISGRFQVVNKYLMNDLKQLGLWTKRIRNKIIEADGSVQSIEEIPRDIRDVYRTVYEYKLTALIRMGADRSAYICQSSSNNRYLPSPDMSLLTNMHLYSWKMGEKTSSYYIRVKQQTTGAKLLDAPDAEEECLSCSA
jgi:ribonucleoside-diphosphate reductase alpha chain